MEEAEATDNPAPGRSAHGQSIVGMVGHPGQSPAQRGVITGWREHAGDTIVDLLGNTSDQGRDDRPSVAHRLQHRERRALASRGEEQRVDLAHERGHVADGSAELHVGPEAEPLDFSDDLRAQLSITTQAERHLDIGERARDRNRPYRA